MVAEDLRQLNSLKGQATSSVLAADNAMLDEFFSLVADIAVRLTSNSARANNDGNTTGSEIAIS